ncbi:MAG: putative membrane protein YfcA [Spirosomataceae bacterium]
MHYIYSIKSVMKKTERRNFIKTGILAGVGGSLALFTSLLIIAAKSLFGFLGDVANQAIDWIFLMQFAGLSIAGIFIGTYLSKFISGAKLKKGFGWIVLLMSIYIIGKEFLN